jgi:hypothetical protein
MENCRWNESFLREEDKEGMIANQMGEKRRNTPQGIRCSMKHCRILKSHVLPLLALVETLES